MLDRQYFFDAVKRDLNLFSGALSARQHDGMSAILTAWENAAAFTDLRWLAYMLATAFHETGRRMQPCEEIGKGHNHLYGRKIKQNGLAYTDTEAVFYGRGLVQITWYENYAKAGAVCGCDMIKHPELALEMRHAISIMFHGMQKGWFTGVGLPRFFKPQDVKTAGAVRAGSLAGNLAAAAAQPSYNAYSLMPEKGNLLTNAEPYEISSAQFSKWKNARKIINGTDCDWKIARYGIAFYKALTPAHTVVAQPRWTRQLL